MHKLVILWVPGVFSNFPSSFRTLLCCITLTLKYFFYNYNRSNLSANYQKGIFLLSTKNITHQLCTKCIYTFAGKSLLHPCFFLFVIWLDINTYCMKDGRSCIKIVENGDEKTLRAQFYVTYSASLFWKVKSNSGCQHLVNLAHHDIFIGLCLR